MGRVDPESKVLCTGREVRLAGLDKSLLPETLMMDMKKGEAAMVRIHGAEKLPRVKSQERSVSLIISQILSLNYEAPFPRLFLFKKR